MSSSAQRSSSTPARPRTSFPDPILRPGHAAVVAADASPGGASPGGASPGGASTSWFGGLVGGLTSPFHASGPSFHHTVDQDQSTSQCMKYVPVCRTLCATAQGRDHASTPPAHPLASPHNHKARGGREVWCCRGGRRDVPRRCGRPS